MKNYPTLPLLVCLFFLWIQPLYIMAQSLSAKEVIEKADRKYKGEFSSTGEMKMRIIRPEWSREMSMKSWSKGDDLAIILITEPARDKGTAFLKRGKEIWNWQPTIDRVIKLPPSMMMQSWMGSDFTNDDLVKESSVVKDYEHAFIGEEMVEDRLCYIIELVPKQEAAVVWGKIITWIDKEDFMQLKAAFYDEDDYLVNSMYGKNIRMMGGKLLPTVLEVVPAEEEGRKTVIEYVNLTFNEPIDEAFFSVQQMKRVR